MACGLCVRVCVICGVSVWGVVVGVVVCAGCVGCGWFGCLCVCACVGVFVRVCVFECV